MQKKIMILVSVLLTSCFSYKTVDTNQVQLKKEDTYKMSTLGGQTKKGRFHARNGGLLIFKNKKGNQYDIHIGEIEEIRIKKFSLGKTIALPVGVTASLVGIIIVGVSSWGPAIDW